MDSSGFPTVGIVGLGQIGGSIALALNSSVEVNFFARSVDARNWGKSKGLVACDSLAELCRRSEILFVAVPVDQISDVLDSMMGNLKYGHIVTDVGSTKADLERWLATSNVPEGVTIVGGHPMAGNAQAGFVGADEILFQGRTWVITVNEVREIGIESSILKLINVITTGLHANVAILDPVDHDRGVAVVSHLEHLIAEALVQMVKSSGRSSLYSTLVAGSFMDATRVAKSASSMVVPFLKSNSFLEESVTVFKNLLDSLMLLRYDEIKLANLWNEGQAWRASLEGRIPDERKEMIANGEALIPQLKKLSSNGELIFNLEITAYGIEVTSLVF